MSKAKKLIMIITIPIIFVAIFLPKEEGFICNLPINMPMNK